MKTEYEKCMAGEPFIGGRDPMIVETIMRTRRLLAQFNAADYGDTARKKELLREMFGSMGKNVHVDIDFHCEYGKNIFVGSNVIINMNCTFVDNNRIDIGSNVLIASNVQIYTATHSTKVKERMVEGCEEGEEICRTIAHPVKNRRRRLDWRRSHNPAGDHYRGKQRYRSRQRGDARRPAQLHRRRQPMPRDKAD